MSRQKQADWAEARRRCRLNSEEVQMAKDLGFQPGKLIKNIPAPSQAWKAPVNEWVRSLYEKKFGSRPPGGTASPARSPSGPGVERRNREDPWPDNPLIPDLPCLVLDENVFPEDDEEPPSEDDILESEGQMLRRQRLFRWAAEAIAVAASELPEVEKVAAFGAVSQPLKPDVPRFRQFRRNRIPILHECADLDFAVWMTRLDRLNGLRKALIGGLAVTNDTPYGGVAHHQVDVHVFDSAGGDYRGRLCIFRTCPKPGKLECRVPGCGAEPFLQQFAEYHFNPARFAAEPKVVLFDRSASFVVPPPRIEGNRRKVMWIRADPGITDRDVPF